MKPDWSGDEERKADEKVGMKRIDVTFEQACWAEESHDGWKVG